MAKAYFSLSRLVLLVLVALPFQAMTSMARAQLILQTTTENKYVTSGNRTVTFNGSFVCGGHWGHGAMAILDGVNLGYLQDEACEGLYVTNGMTCSLPIGEIFSHGACSHKLVIRAMVRVEPCGSSFVYQEQFSNPVTIWIDDPSTSKAECMSGCNAGPDCSPGRITVAGPVDVATGKMYYERNDLRIGGPFPIEVTRRYENTSTYQGALGYGWQHNFMIRLESPSTRKRVLIDREMRRVEFSSALGLGGWFDNTLNFLTLSQGTDPPWQIGDTHGNEWDFDSAGKLEELRDRNGNQIVVGYNGSGQLNTIADEFGRVVSLTYHTSGRLATLSAGGRTVKYCYDSSSAHLARVEWTDGSCESASSCTTEGSCPFEEYFYGGDNADGDSHNLVQVLDSSGDLIEGHWYEDDKVIRTESQGGNDQYLFAYDSATQTTVTNARGEETVYTFNAETGLVTSTLGPGCASCSGGGGTNSQLVYYPSTAVKQSIDGEGIATEFEYDIQGNMTKRTEALGTSSARVTNYTYHPEFNFPATITVPTVGSCGNSRVVTNGYDSDNGDLLSQQISGCSGSAAVSQTTAYSYDDYGQVETIDGPRTDVSDITEMDYYDSGETSDVNQLGRPRLKTNALGRETSYEGYDVFGNVGSITDPNGVETMYLYNLRNQATEVRIHHGETSDDDIVIENHYDLDGNLDLVRLPSCVDTGSSCAYSLDYGYDEVNRLEEIYDPFGNKILYTYDLAGNRTREEFRDESNVVQRFTNFKYDGYNRLAYAYFTGVEPDEETEPGEDGAVFYKYQYYDDGQRHTQQDLMGHVTTYTYDELRRVETVAQATASGALTTTYGYDTQDNLTSVTDPGLLETTYTNSDLGWRLSTDSPDTGTTAYDYDAAGNLIEMEDANGVTSTRTYDALNRLLTVSYPFSDLNVTHDYDSTVVEFGIGRRTGMTDASGVSTYSYDRRGLLAREEKTIDENTYVTQYVYDKSGNLEQLLYPTADQELRQGQADYSYDEGERVSLITAQVGGSTTTVAESFSYRPFGPRTGMTFGNELTDARSYGNRYELLDWTLGGLASYTHAYDDDLNLTGRTDNLNSANNRTFGYDEIHRLTEAEGPWGAGTACDGQTYTYDANGNRLCKGEGTTATSYDYDSASNQLEATTTGSEVVSYEYDANGNTTGDGSHSYEYSDANRLASVDEGDTATYLYDGDGRRVTKTVGTKTTHFFYDPSGRLLSEIVPGDGSGKDYVYNDGVPIARVDWTTEEPLGDVLRAYKDATSVDLDWTLYPDGGSNTYVVRRKDLAAGEKTFEGAEAIATVSDPTQTYTDAPGDADRYDYRVFRRAVSESLFFYHTDHLETPLALTDANGTAKWRTEDTPFGEQWGESLALVTNSLRFSGQYEDAETGLHQNWFRDYQPRVGRYVQSDPLGLDGDDNSYSYAGSNPMARTDRTGTTWWGNAVFLRDWWYEQADNQRIYREDRFQTKEMMQSAAARYMRQAFRWGQCQDIDPERASYGTGKAFLRSAMFPWRWGRTETQLGGFKWDATNLKDGQVQYHIHNVASLNSFLYHIWFVPSYERSKGWIPSFGGNITQDFYWTEPSPCKCGRK